MTDSLKADKIFEYVNFYERNLRDSVIPFWLKYSPDFEYGGTYSCLDADGAVYDTRKYVWLMARSVWMFTRLYNDYEKNPEFLKIAELGLDFIEKYATDEDGCYYFGLTKEGRPFSRREEIYESVFCMLAFAEYSKIKDSEKYYQKSLQLFRDISAEIFSGSSESNDQFSEGVIRLSNLADLMVLSDMAMQLYEIDKKPDRISFISDIISKLKIHYDPQRKILMEQVACDGTDISEWTEGRYFSPGHSIEVCWFLMHMDEYVPDQGLVDLALQVIESSLELGWDHEYGGLFNYTDILNKPGIWIEPHTKLWWPHAESLYAIMLAYKKTGDEKLLGWLEKMHSYTVEHFIDQEKGGWYGFCDRYGNLINNAKGGHSKGFFHVPRALLYITKLYD